MTRSKQALILGDIHVPYENKTALRLVRKIVKHLDKSLTHVISVGDMCDAYSASRFDKNPERKYRLQDEIDLTVALAQKIKGWCPEKTRCVITLGNHEVRIDKLAAKLYEDLGHVRSLQLARGLEAAGWEVFPYRQSYFLTDHFAITHDFERAGKTALQNAVADCGVSIAFGHTHNAGTWYTGSVHDSTKMAINVGWLGDHRFVDYRHAIKAKRGYILGVGLVSLGPDGLFSADFIPFIERGRQMWACVHGEWIHVLSTDREVRGEL